jgi:hypothetical protein
MAGGQQRKIGKKMLMINGVALARLDKGERNLRISE